jgi:hypothetical protein
MNLFKFNCRYMSKCNGYRDNSVTCIKELDKSFCGIYKQFEQSKIEIYTLLQKHPALHLKTVSQKLNIWKNSKPPIYAGIPATTLNTKSKLIPKKKYLNL